MSGLVPIGADLPVSTREEQVAGYMEAAREDLRRARDLNDAKQLADRAAVLVEWLKRQTNLGTAIANDASLLRLQAEARMGEFLCQPGAVRTERGRPEKTSDAPTFSAPTHRELGIKRDAAQVYREVASVPGDTLRELAEKATASGKQLTREAVLKVAKKLRPAPAAEPEEAPAAALPAIPPDLLNRIVTGDARQLAARIPNGSVAVCLCDPVYDRVDDYRWLAAECERVLAPGGSVVVQCGNLHRFTAECAMREGGLTFVDLLAEVYPYALGRNFPGKMFIGWKPHLWFSRGKRSSPWLMNRVAVGGKPYADEAKDIHPWGDSEQFAAGVLAKCCGPGDLVWDPFTGSGTVPVVCKRLGLPFVAFEIDADAAESARDRLTGTRRERSPQASLLFEEAV